MMILTYLCLAVCMGSTQIVMGQSDLNREPVCSKFDYEMRTLETMLRTENSVEKMKEEMEKTKKLALEELAQIADFKAKLLDQFEEYKQLLESQTKRQVEMVKEEMLEKMETKLQSFDEVSNRPLKPDPVIAFSVTDPTRKLSNGVPTFKRVITNIGDAYDIDTGLFTSPVDGLYMFVLIVSTTSRSNTYCLIKLNGVEIAVSQTNGYAYTTAANAMYLLLVKGDIVSLGRCLNVESFYSEHGAFVYSGALIKQTN